MEKRREKILYTIVKEHIATGSPVGSEILVSKYKLGVSSATVRNEMAELEDNGFIIQPHTSAGRIPTEKAMPTIWIICSMKRKSARMKKVSSAG